MFGSTPNSRALIRTFCVLLLLGGVACRRQAQEDPPPPAEEALPAEPISSQAFAPAAEAEGLPFAELEGAQTGIDFTNRWDPSGRQAGELTGPFAGGGVAIGDYDGDGRPDLYLTRPIGGSKLYRNLGDWKFEDVTRAAGVDDPALHGTGASFVDIDDDGDLDLHVCCYDGPNRMYVNGGDGTFVDRASEMGLAWVRASVMCSFADYDNDGDLDAYLLTNSRPPKGPIQLRPIQVDGEWTVPEPAREHKGVVLRDEVNLFYIDAGEADHLLRNDGESGPDGLPTFTDVSREAGIAGYDIGLAATWLDANGDGLQDLYVANDFFTPDHLWINNADGTFTDRIAETFPHTPWYSMGSDAADINNDGLIDLMGTDMAGTNHYKSKVSMGNMQDNWFLDYPTPRQYMRNAVYLNTGTDRWMEVAFLTGLASTDWTWAVKFGDLDNDGWVDLFVANGMTRAWFNSDLRNSLMRSTPAGPQMVLEDWLDKPLQREPNLAFRNLGDLNFESVGDDWGLNHEGVSFGAAMGDLDGDGDLDIVVNHFEEPVGVYRNNSASGHRMALRLHGDASNRFGIGAEVRVETGDGVQLRTLSPYGGFYSSSEPHLHFGLGEQSSIDKLTIDWPSGRRQVFTELQADRLYTIVEPESGERGGDAVQAPKFVRSELLSGAAHEEQPFDDFARQPLLPNRLSQLGPGIAWGDVDGDGDEDFYLSGAKGSPGRLFINDGEGGFEVGMQSGSEAGGIEHEEMAPLLFDADGDGDLDLYLVSGGVECEPGDPSLRDRLLLNNGDGSFAESPAGVLPDLRDSGGVATAADFDRDGDLDLFVGGRSIPGRYPLTPRSRLLRNGSLDGGASGALGFTDVTDEVAAGLAGAGMVTGALWTDADGDGWLDLMVTHEWGAVRFWRNIEGKLVDTTEAAGLSGLGGWWNGITGGDVDGDGDIDYAVTNFGLNTKYRASAEVPALLYYGDFDGTGKPRIVEAKEKSGAMLPLRGKSCSTDAMPFLAERFPTFHSFAAATLDEIYTPKLLSDAAQYSASELRSGVLINDGTAKFEFRPLPRLAQASPGFGAALSDVDCDGDADLYVVQNFFGPQVETGRMGGGLSLLLAGEGDGTFRPVWPKESGLVVPGDAKGLAVTDLNGDGWPDFVVGVNDGPVVVFENAGAGSGSGQGGRPLVIGLEGGKGNPTAVGARVELHLTDGSVQAAEVYAGSGYLSQSSPKISFGVGSSAGAAKVEVRWPDGSTSEHPVAPGDKQLTLRQPGL